MVTHNEMFLKSLATKLIVFDRDKISIFSGTYQDFLENVGWQTDDDEISSIKEQQTEMKKENAVNKKELRRKRADFFKETSKKIKPLENKVKDIEYAIEKIESDINRNYAELAAFSESGNSNEISRLSKLDFELKNKITGFYESLEKNMALYENEKKEFEKQLADFDAMIND